MYGKGPDYGSKGSGQWMQYDWDYPPHHTLGATKGQGKGKGKGFTKGQSQGQAGANANMNIEKKDRKIKQLEDQLENLKAKTAAHYRRGRISSPRANPRTRSFVRLAEPSITTTAS